MLCGCAGTFPVKDGWIQVLAGLAPSSQTVQSLLRTPWQEKPTRKIYPKKNSANLLQQEKL